MVRASQSASVVFLSLCSAVGVACTSSNGGAPAAQAGSPCTSTSACYPGIDAAALKGQVACLTQLQGGYCTHACQTDADCCAIPGECQAGLTEVCASFESSGQMYCFVNCDSSSISSDPTAGTTDPTTFCQRWANPTASCRSTGGGGNNRKFCGP